MSLLRNTAPNSPPSKRQLLPAVSNIRVKPQYKGSVKPPTGNNFRSSNHRSMVQQSGLKNSKPSGKSVISVRPRPRTNVNYAVSEEKLGKLNSSKFHFTSPRLNAARNSSAMKRPAIGPQSEDDQQKLTLVLDVDETLIHSRLSGPNERYRQMEERKESANSCEEFSITLEDGDVIWVNKRPGLDSFLNDVSQRYEVVAYTAGLEEYARPLLDWLDPKGEIFRHRFYRDSCLFIRGYYVKDLAKLNRNLSRTVLVDNNAFCFLPQLSNGIPISSFYDDPTDNALQVLNSFLRRLEDEEDVRPILDKSFNLQSLLREHREQILG